MDMYDIIARREDVKVADYFDTDFKDKYDLIITNPPYLRDSLKTKRGLADMIAKMLDDVQVGGNVILFLKTIHLESQARYEKVFATTPPTNVNVYSYRMKCLKDGKEITGGSSAISYSIFAWLNKHEDGTFDTPTTINWITKD